MNRLDDKVAIVFGAGQMPGDTIGNGRASAILYARAGAKVACVDLDIASAEETCAMIEGEGGVAIALRADVTREDQVRSAIDACVAAFGPVDVLHNNVGASPGDSFDAAAIEEAVIDNSFALIFKSALFAAKHVLPSMRARKTGSIVNISSIAAVCSGQAVLYKTLKLALNGLTQQMAIANAEHGVRVNAVMPGFIDTPVAIESISRHRSVAPEIVRTQRDICVPLRKRQGSAWDVARAALFLASEDAAFVTGVILPVDGGQSIRIG